MDSESSPMEEASVDLGPMSDGTEEQHEEVATAEPASSKETKATSDTSVADCNCATCKKTRELAKKPSDTDSALSKKELNQQMKKIKDQLEGAPDDVKKSIKSFIRANNDPDWILIMHHFIAKMSEVSSKKFSPTAEDGKTWVGFGHRSMKKESQTFQSIRLPTGITTDGMDIFGGSESAENLNLVVSPTHAGSNAYRDYVSLEQNRIRVFIDIPLSLIWGELSYMESVLLVQNIARIFNYEYSEEKTFIRLLQPLNESLKKRIKDDLKRAQQQLEEYHSSIRKVAREWHDKTIHQTALETGTNIREVAKGFVDLASRGFYTSISVDGQQIRGVIKNVSITWEDNVYDFGEFEVNLNASDGQVLANRLNGPELDNEQISAIAQHYHPHVLSTGGCCLGNYQELITKAVLEQKFHTAMSYMYEFLTTYNSSNPYVDIEAWLTKEQRIGKVNSEVPEPERYRMGARERVYNYTACHEESLQQHGSGAGLRLRCLDKPFGDDCARCPFHGRQEEMLNDCHDQSSTERCMNCDNSDCPHLAIETTACLVAAVSTARSESSPIECTACPYGRQSSCDHAQGDIAFEHCWEVQNGKQKDSRACVNCTLSACPHFSER